jgi:hypothetical protein
MMMTVAGRGQDYGIADCVIDADTGIIGGLIAPGLHND